MRKTRQSSFDVMFGDSLAVPEILFSRYRSQNFDRGANPCSLYLAPRALASVAFQVPSFSHKTKRPPNWVVALFGARDGTFLSRTKAPPGLSPKPRRPSVAAFGVRFKSRLKTKNSRHPVGDGSFFWCERRDLNPYVERHTHLKRACLPIPALSLITTDIIALPPAAVKKIFHARPEIAHFFRTARRSSSR